MKVFVVLSAVLACTMGQVFYGGYPGLGYSPYALSPYPYSPFLRHAAPLAAPVAAPIITVPTASQYHAQDELGQFTFSHAGDNQARIETKTFDGTVSGAYSYVDPNGKLINVNYLADDNGFRVIGANNLPIAPAVPAVPELKGPEPVQDTAEVVAARAEFEKKFAEAKAAAAAAPEVVEPEVAAAAAAAAPEAEVVVARRKRAAVLLSSILAPGLAKTTLKYKQYEAIDAATPADTKAIELKDKEQEILTPTLTHVQVQTPIVAPIAYHAYTSPLALSHYQVPSLYHGQRVVYL